MTDRIERIINSSVGKKLLGSLGVTPPVDLARYQPQQRSYFSGELLLDAGDNAELLPALLANLQDSEASIHAGDSARRQLADAGASLATGSDSYRALIFDASGLNDSLALTQAYHFFNQHIRKLTRCGRILILGRPHRQCDSAERAATQRALEGLSRSLAKEIGKKGATAQLLTVESGAQDVMDSALRFLLSPKAAYISGQVLRVSKAQHKTLPDWHQPLVGKVALVTGASRGIGEAIADTLARDGATVLGVDVAAMEGALHTVMKRMNGKALVADITAADAPAAITAALKEMGGADLIVHNAGVTRDKTIANMSEQQWQMTLNINLAAAQRINAALLADNGLNEGGSIVGVSSMNGIAGQRGQTNYAASKAGVIGYVDYMSQQPELLAKGITVNAVAPGFIETAMTASMPLMPRLFGRRLNSLSQGGQPIDVAEAIAMFANPASRGVNGNVLRVCGQAWFGA